MKHLIFSSLSLIALLSVSSCREEVVIGRGDIHSEARSINGSFDKIEISAPVDAEIQVSAGAAPSVQMDGYANILKYLKVEVKGSTLHISIPETVELHTERNAIARITLPSLSGVSVSGAADANIKGDVTGSKLDIDISGSGDASVQSIHVTDLKVELNGAASFTATTGKVGRAVYEISGSGEVDAFGMETEDTRIEVAGSGSANIMATKSLNAEISGSGNVAYKGHPAITKEVSGVGSIDDAN